jgi:hypothetical protein
MRLAAPDKIAGLAAIRGLLTRSRAFYDKADLLGVIARLEPGNPVTTAGVTGSPGSSRAMTAYERVNLIVKCSSVHAR